MIKNKKAQVMSLTETIPSLLTSVHHVTFFLTPASSAEVRLVRNEAAVR